MESKSVKIKDALSFRRAGEAISRLTEERDQLIYQRDDLLAALRRISSWSEHTVKFAVDHGSNGVRDLYRSIADEAIAKCEVKS